MNKYKLVSLTFDDGPEPKTTPQLLDILKKYNAKATFFLLGMKIKLFPELAKRIQDEGHEILNHGYDHTSFFKLTNEEIITQLKDTNYLIENITNKPTLCFRPPYEETNYLINDYIFNNLNMVMSKNTLYSNDCDNISCDSIFNKIFYNIKHEDVIVLHDFNPETIKAIELLLTTEKIFSNYQFVTYSTLINNT